LCSGGSNSRARFFTAFKNDSTERNGKTLCMGLYVHKRFFDRLLRATQAWGRTTPPRTGGVPNGSVTKFALVGVAANINRVILERSEESCNYRGGLFLKYF
jgi:hypothetical protein